MKQDEKIKELEKKIRQLEESNKLLSQQKLELEEAILQIKQTRRVPMLTRHDRQLLQQRYYEAKRQSTPGTEDKLGGGA